jgi:hypothetical protein
MPVGHKDPCPCGSGKKYKHCHMKKDLEKRQHGVWYLLGAAVVLGGALIYFAAGGGIPWGGGRASAPAGAGLPVTTGAPAATGPATVTQTTTATSAASQDQSALPGGATPQPWQYDAPRNRHWHPGHGHWHNGPPPDPSQREATAATATTTPASDQSPLPGGITPTPNFYDAPRDRYWSAEHAHWHPGRPPAIAPGTAGPAPAPKP